MLSSIESTSQSGPGCVWWSKSVEVFFRWFESVPQTQIKIDYKKLKTVWQLFNIHFKFNATIMSIRTTLIMISFFRSSFSMKNCQTVSSVGRWGHPSRKEQFHVRHNVVLFVSLFKEVVGQYKLCTHWLNQWTKQKNTRWTKMRWEKESETWWSFKPHRGTRNARKPATFLFSHTLWI